MAAGKAVNGLEHPPNQSVFLKGEDAIF